MIVGLQHLFSNNILQAEEVNWQKLKNENSYILQSDPDNILANFKLMVALANLGQVKEAYLLIEKMEDQISIKKFEETIEPYLDSLNQKGNKNKLLFLNYSAFSAMIKHNYRDASSNFIKIKKIEPENIWIRNYLAVSYMELNKYDEAEAELKQTLVIKENNYSHLILGVIYYNQGNFLKSLQEFSRSGDLFKIMLDMFL